MKTKLILIALCIASNAMSMEEKDGRVYAWEPIKKVQTNQTAVNKKPIKRRSKSTVTRRESNLLHNYSDTAKLIASSQNPQQTPVNSNFRRIHSDVPRTTSNQSVAKIFSETVPTFCALVIPLHLKQITNRFESIPSKEISPELEKKIAALCKLMKEITNMLSPSQKRVAARQQIMKEKLSNQSKQAKLKSLNEESSSLESLQDSSASDSLDSSDWE